MNEPKTATNMRVPWIKTTQLQNAEHFEFMTGINTAITAHDPQAIDIGEHYALMRHRLS